MQPTEIINYEYGTIACYDNYLVVVMNQGITVKPEYNADLVDLAENYFKGRPFGYITHRKNSYAVDPSVYRETSKIENLVAFAVVSTKEITAQTVKVEKMFLEKPFQLFAELDEAIAWVSEKVENAK